MWFDAFYVSMLSEKIKTVRKKHLRGNNWTVSIPAFFGNKEFSSQIFIVRHKSNKAF